MNLCQAQLKPVKTAEGEDWCQNCYVCNKQINFFKMPREKWVRIDFLVRHKKCWPGMPK